MIIATYFKLIRWKNLLLISFLYFVLKCLLFNKLELETSLSIFEFFILLLSVISITAAGYIINDIYDVKADLINKPTKVIISKKISLETSLQWYKITNAIGIILGAGISIAIEKPTYVFIFIAAALLLYYYTKYLKSLAIIGNLSVSILIVISILTLPLFELNLSIKSNTQNLAISIIYLLVIFAFSTNLIREIVKDLEDINGDYTLNMSTLPILIGRERTKEIASILCLLPLSLLAFIITNFGKEYMITTIYLLIFTFLPLMYVMLKLRSFKKKQEFHKISTMLKIVMFLGINSVLIFSIFQL